MDSAAQLATVLKVKQDRRYKVGKVFPFTYNEFDPDQFEQNGFTEMGTWGWRNFDDGCVIDLVGMKLLDRYAAAHYVFKDTTGRFV